MKSSFSPEQDGELHRLYSAGLNDYEVAKEFHVGRNRLREWRKVQGLLSKTRKKGLTVDICLDVLRILSNGSDLTGVAKKYGVKRTSIARLLKKKDRKSVV